MYSKNNLIDNRNLPLHPEDMPNATQNFPVKVDEGML